MSRRARQRRDRRAPVPDFDDQDACYNSPNRFSGN